MHTECDWGRRTLHHLLRFVGIVLPWILDRHCIRKGLARSCLEMARIQRKAVGRNAFATVSIKFLCSTS